MVLEADQANARFGESVATAGDVNGDGYSDVIVGAPRYDSGQNNEGRAFVYPGGPRGLRGSPIWTAESNQADAWFGLAVATAGDVNGDGYSDVIVGAPYYENGEGDEGRAYLFLGGANGLGANPAWSVESNQASAYFGTSVAAAGDVNGDGYSDVIVGAPSYDNGQNNEGRAYVYHGGSGGLAATPAWTVESNAEGAALGRSVATAGDVNGDGYAGVIVGVPGYKFGQINEGRAFVYQGGAAGVGGNPILTAESNQAEANLGASVATAGDVNGDGYADVIIGAPSYDNLLPDTGAVFIHFGRSGAMNDVPDWRVVGYQKGAQFGTSVATAGDVNGDGYADVIVGTPYYHNGQDLEGRAEVYYGAKGVLRNTPAWTAEGNQALATLGVSVVTAGDVNGDGFSDVIVGASGYDNGQTDEGRAFVYHGAADGVTTIYAWRAESNQEFADFGMSVGTAGDVNGDGYADVIVGAYQYDNGLRYAGRAFVYHGGPNGLGASPAWTAEGSQAEAHFGNSVATAGDVNGDGYSDVIVGAWGFDHNGQAAAGRAYVFHGGLGGLNAFASWTRPGNQKLARFGGSVATAGDVNGDGFADVIVGAREAGNSKGGRAYVYTGGPDGVGGIPAWSVVGTASYAGFGIRVATAGDVNGDGYADIIVGAYNFNASTTGSAHVYHGGPGGLATSPAWTVKGGQWMDSGFGVSVGTAGDVNGDGYAGVIVGAYGSTFGVGGRAFVFYGSGGGVDVHPRQRRWNLTAPIAPGGLSDRPDAFRLSMIGRTPFGRSRIKQEWEVKPLGVLFDGKGIGASPDWLNPGTGGAAFNQVISGLKPGTPYHWRVRVRYHPATTPFQQYSRWITVPWNGWNETDLRTASARMTYLPLVRR